MSFEVIHAWAQRGLDGDGPGYVTVVRTAGTPRAIERVAIAHSGHRLPEDERPTLALRRFERADGVWAILTSTVPCDAAAADGTATGTTTEPRRLAHHLILDELDLQRIDLARVVAEWRSARTHAGTPEERETPPLSADIASASTSTVAAAWEAAVGDAGWAGEAIERLRSLGDEPLVVLLPDGADTAALAADLMALLPPDERPRLAFADRLRRRDEGLRLVLVDETALRLAEKPPPGGAARLDLRKTRDAERPGRPDHAAAETSRRGDAVLSIARSRRTVDLGATEAEPRDDATAETAWRGSIEVRLDEETPERGRWWLLVAAGLVVLVLAAFAFSSDLPSTTGARW